LTETLESDNRFNPVYSRTQSPVKRGKKKCRRQGSRQRDFLKQVFGIN